MIKFGSVQFFKILILTMLGACIVVPVTCAIVLAAKNGRLEKELAAGSGGDDSNKNAGSPIQTPGYRAMHEDFRAPVRLVPGASWADPSDPPAASTVAAAAGADPRTVFLSFDDGPSSQTGRILETLEAQGIKATFFLTGRMMRARPGDAKAIADKGHVIGMHGDSHDYIAMYASIEAFLDDFYRCFLSIEAETGKSPSMLRFPGGSINPYNALRHQAMIAEMLRRGFWYCDWNVDSGDLLKDATAESVAENVIAGVKTAKTPKVVLLHDSGAEATVGALPEIIEGLRAEGYSFASLDEAMAPLVFAYKE